MPLDWVAHNWPFVAGVGGVFITVGINVQMLRAHGVELKKVVVAANTLNGSVDKIITSISSCQNVQKLMLEGRIREIEE